MIKEGWSIFSGEKTHYYLRGKRFWNDNATYLPDPHNPGFGRKEGYFYMYKSLCGKSDFLLPVRENPDLITKTKSNHLCLRCVIILLRMRGLA